MQKINVELAIDRSKLNRSLKEKISDKLKDLSKTHIVTNKDTKFTEVKTKAAAILKRKFKTDAGIDYKFYFGKTEITGDAFYTEAGKAIKEDLDKVKDDAKKKALEKKLILKKLSTAKIVATLPNDFNIPEIEDGQFNIKLFLFDKDSIKFKPTETINADNVKDANSKIKTIAKDLGYIKPSFYILNVPENATEIELKDVFKNLEEKFDPKKIADKSNINIIPVQPAVTTEVVCVNFESRYKMKITEKTKYMNIKNAFLKSNKVKFLNDKLFVLDDFTIGSSDYTISKESLQGLKKSDLLNILRLMPPKNLFCGFNKLEVKYTLDNTPKSHELLDGLVKNITISDFIKRLNDNNIKYVSGGKSEDDDLISLKKELVLTKKN